VWVYGSFTFVFLPREHTHTALVQVFSLWKSYPTCEPDSVRDKHYSQLLSGSPPFPSSNSRVSSPIDLHPSSARALPLVLSPFLQRLFFALQILSGIFFKCAFSSDFIPQILLNHPASFCPVCLGLFFPPAIFMPFSNRIAFLESPPHPLGFFTPERIGVLLFLPSLG